MPNTKAIAIDKHHFRPILIFTGPLPLNKPKKTTLFIFVLVKGSSHYALSNQPTFIKTQTAVLYILEFSKN